MSGGRVLVVDDDPDCRSLYAVWLEESYTVEAVGSGGACMDRIEWPDVVVLDRQMPGVDGVAVTERIEDHHADPYVVMVSGVEPHVDIVDLSVDAYLTKPVAGDDLRETVDTMVARGDCETALREFFALQARKRALESRLRPTTLHDDDRYDDLLERLERRRATVRENLERFDESRQEEILEALGDGEEGVGGLS